MDIYNTNIYLVDELETVLLDVILIELYLDTV